MNFFSLLLSAAKPSGLWTILIDWFQSGIGNFGWTIFILVFVVKLVISPLDFAVKLSTKKQNLIQQKCAPQVEKIRKKFGKDQNSVKIQTASLYKREGLKSGVGCLVMLLNLVLTMTIFFTFYSSLTKNSAYQALNQYEILNTTFNAKSEEVVKDYLTQNGIDKTPEALLNEYDAALSYITSNPQDAQDYEANKNFVETYSPIIDHSIGEAQKATLQKWSEIKAKWLWIDNIWVADAPTNPFPTFEKIQSLTKGSYQEYFTQNVNEGDYNVIANLINENGERTNNGYYILAVLAAVITFLSQYISELHTRLKNKKANIVAKNAADSSLGFSMKLMKIIMPIIMLTFVLTSSASFGIYILASNISSIAFGEISTLIVNKCTHKKQIEVEQFLEKEANRLIKKGKLQEK